MVLPKRELLVKTIHQVFTIARTEFRFGLRRSAPLVMTALIGLLVGTGILMGPIAMLKDLSPVLNDMTPEQIERLTAEGFTVDEYQQLVSRFIADWSSAGSAPLAWDMMFMALLLLPIATAATIPADRKFEVMEVLRSTPISGSNYLAGKILGVLAIVIATGLVPFLLFLVILEVLLLSFLHVGISISTLMFYIELSLMDGLPLLACGSAIGVLTGVFFHTRRGAIFPGLIAGLVGLFLWLFAFKTPPTTFPVEDVASYYVFQNYHSDALTAMFKISGTQGFGLLGEHTTPVGIGQVISMYITLLVIFFILFLLARLWLHVKENF
jgi:ABC-type transport system involved in multi-copper enzyme maturation permease subunit